MSSTATIAARPQHAAKRYIYAFGGGSAEGDGSMRDLLGGKGAGLAEMTNAGLPVPPGFTITTEACNDYFEAGETLPAGLWDDVLAAVAWTEAVTSKGFGDTTNPLLVSVRSGSKLSMPGMMDTVLNLGLNDATLDGLVALTGNERFGWDAYRRFIAMFGRIVLDVPGERFDHALDAVKERLGVHQDTEVDAAGLREVADASKAIVREATGRDFPQDPLEQLDLATKAVFASWFGKRAVDYRDYHKIAHDLGTAVNVVTMVFGNMGDDSGTGVAFTRDPNTGERVLFGEYLTNAQGEDVVAGIRTPFPIAQLRDAMPEVYAEFGAIAERLEGHYRDMQDLEFTIERGRLFMLQTRSAKRTAVAAVRIASDMVEEGIISREEAVGRIEPAMVDQLLRDQYDPEARSAATRIAKGLNASPGAAVGRAVFSADSAVEWVARGERVVLVRVETSPDDFHGMAVAQGILTARGGATSHAAVVARQIGKPCVAGCAELVVDYASGSARSTETGASFKEGDWISLDGTTGDVFAGSLATVSARYEEQADLQRILGWADAIRRLGVWTNADKPEEAAQARSYGAEGIGLCRTEHMFREGERLEIVRGADPRRGRGDPREGEAGGRRGARRRRGGDRHPLRRRDGRARGAPAGRLRGHLPRDGWPAGRHPVDRSAAPRVPAQPRGAARQGHEGRGRRERRGPRAAGHDPLAARAEPDARPAGRAPGPDDPRLREGPDPRDPRRADRGQEGGRQPDREDHDPARRPRERARSDAGAARDRGEGDRGARRRVGRLQVRHDDRGAARRPDRRRDRPRSVVLQLRHERPDADDVRLLARRRRRRVPAQVRRGQGTCRSTRSRRSMWSASGSSSGWRSRRAARRVPTSSSGSAASMAATRSRSRSSTRSGSTT